MKAGTIFDLTGEVALVTGASSGLGARFAQVLAANGAKVALVARRKERLDDLSKRIVAAGGSAIAIEADVLDRSAMLRAFDQVEAAFGTVTILVNNAGAAQGVRALDMSADEWRRILSLDLDSVFFWSQEGARRMLAAGSTGAIVNIASVLAFGVSKGVAAYAVAKAGVMQLTKALSLELAFKGVRVNAIAPGWFVTEINRGFLESDQGEKMKRCDPDGPLRRGGRSRRRAAVARIESRCLHDRCDDHRRWRPGGRDRVDSQPLRDLHVPLHMSQIALRPISLANASVAFNSLDVKRHRITVPRHKGTLYGRSCRTPPQPRRFSLCLAAAGHGAVAWHGRQRRHVVLCGGASGSPGRFRGDPRRRQHPLHDGNGWVCNWQHDPRPARRPVRNRRPRFCSASPRSASAMSVRASRRPCGSFPQPIS